MKTLINDKWEFSDYKNPTIEVDLPFDAMLHGQRDANCLNGTNSGFFVGGKYIYKKVLNFSKEDLDKRVYIFFEGVYQNSTIKLNENVVGSHKYGYTEFKIDLSDKIKEGENLLEVYVDNSLEPNCRWYSGAGIYRNVWLIKEDKKAPTYLKIKTLSIDPKIIEINSDANEIEIYDKDKLIYKGSNKTIELKDAKLWSVEIPYLYTCKAKNKYGEIVTKFGIRVISLDQKKGLLLNGKRILLRGGCVHHDNGMLGACSYKESEYRKVKIIKSAGFNAIRSAHNPATNEFLNACDELGMLVLDESFDGWYIPKTYHDYSRYFYSEYKNDLLAMVEKDYNHPSVILYSIGNEVSETGHKEGIDLTNKMRSLIKSIDDTRLVTCGINVTINVYEKIGIAIYKDNGNYEPVNKQKGKKYKEKKSGSAFFNAVANKLSWIMKVISKTKITEKNCQAISPYLDIIGLNYGSGRYAIDLKKYPYLFLLGTETMVMDLPYNWKYTKNYNHLLGDFVWSAWDYLGESGVGDWLYYSYNKLPLLAGSGVIDITGNITAENYFEQIVWGIKKEPYIGVRPLNHNHERPKKSSWRFTNAVASWNWQGYEKEKAIVEVYSQGYYVKLYLNNKLIDHKKLKNYIAIFKVSYEPGTLTAVAFDKEGNELGKTILISGKACKIKIKVEEKITNDDVYYVPIEFVDENGNICPYVEKKVIVKTEGCKLLGLGSGLVNPKESYSSNEFTTYRGRALAVIKKEKSMSNIIVISDNEEIKVRIGE